MYEQVFNLTSRPFTSMHYVKHYFPSKDIEDTLQMCKMTIDRGTGPVVVVGDHGTGKTLLLAMLEETFKAKYLLVNISAAAIRNREDLLQNILYQLQVYSRGMAENDMRMQLIENLRNDKSNGIVLLVDDAQKLSTESIEELQLYLDFIREGQPHVRLVLAGSRGLEDRLADSRLVAFNQRVSGRGFLGCLCRDETEAYIRAHLERSGGDPDALFHPEAYRAIQDVTDGRPRFINQVCDHAMIFSATRGIVPITDSLIREAWFDIHRLPGASAPAGSGAAASETVAGPTIESGEAEGWTVLEFGQLDDAAAADQEVSSENETPQVQDTPADEVQEVSPVAETPQLEQPLEQPQAQQPQAAQEQAQQQESEPAQESFGLPAMAIPTAAGGAAILATAMQGFGATQEPAEEASQPVEPPAMQASLEETAPAAEQDEVPQETANPEPAQPVSEDPFGSHQYEDEEVLTDAYSPFVAQQNQRSLGVTSDQLQGLTPADLQNTESPQPTADATTEDADESFPTFETAMQPADPVREPVKPSSELRDTVETREEAGPLGPNSLSEEFLVNRTSVLTNTETLLTTESPEPVSVGPVDEQVAASFVPLDPNADPVASIQEQYTAGFEAASQEQTETEATEAPSQPAMPAAIESPEQFVAPNVSVPDVPFTTNESNELGQAAEPQAPSSVSYHEQLPDPEDSEIRRQAEEIIRGLKDSDDAAPASTSEPFPVSHETTSVEPAIEEETNAIEATIQRSIEAGQASDEPAAGIATPPPVVMPDINAIQQALQAAQSGSGYQQQVTEPQSTPGQSGLQQLSPQNWPVPSPTAPQQSTQDQAVEQAAEPAATPAEDAPTQEIVPQQAQTQEQQVPALPSIPRPTSIPVQMAPEPMETEQQILQQVREQSAMISETTQRVQDQANGQDDRDILAINADQEAGQTVAASSAEDKLPAWTNEDPSTGEAARVDYQKLFDQLRNVPGHQE